MIAYPISEIDPKDAPASRTESLIRLDTVLPAQIDRQLGYRGDARFCLFYVDARAEGVIWNDGHSYGFGPGAWRAFDEQIEPLARHLGIALDGRQPDSHVLLIDRLQRTAYFAPYGAAEQIIDEPDQQNS